MWKADKVIGVVYGMGLTQRVSTLRQHRHGVCRRAISVATAPSPDAASPPAYRASARSAHFQEAGTGTAGQAALFGFEAAPRQGHEHGGACEAC